jgi:hypothetical protein
MIGIAVLIATNPAAADAHSFDLIGVVVVDNWLAPAFLSVVGVSQMCLSLVILARPSLGIRIYAVLTGIELFSIYRALARHHGRYQP